MARQLRTVFKASDLLAVYEGGIGAFKRLPPRCRLPDMDKDLTEPEKRILAYFEASVQQLVRMGALPAEQAERFFPEVFTKVNEVIDEEVYAASANNKGVVRKK